MSENTTQETPDARSFEERVFARFDALDARLSNQEARFDALDARLTTLEDKVDARLRETRPIWEAVLSRLDTIDRRLDKIEDEIKTIKRQVRVLHDDILRTREDQEDLRERVTKLESEPSTSS